MEADVGSHLDRIETVRAAADQFVERGHFDADNIRAKQVGRICAYSARIKICFKYTGCPTLRIPIPQLIFCSVWRTSFLIVKFSPCFSEG